MYWKELPWKMMHEKNVGIKGLNNLWIHPPLIRKNNLHFEFSSFFPFYNSFYILFTCPNIIVLHIQKRIIEQNCFLKSFCYFDWNCLSKRFHNNIVRMGIIFVFDAFNMQNNNTNELMEVCNIVSLSSYTCR